jgi:hypothetical protein
MFEYESKHYDPKTDDLFLVYTAIDESFNANGWRVQDIDKNIKSGLGRPGIIKPKDPNNPHESNQNGQFVHPIFPNASLQALLQNQESYSIARAVRLDRPSTSSPWRVWLQVTDPNAKVALKNASTNSNNYPKYISPQVITFPSDFPDEEEAKTYKHWMISHWAFVDQPAYGEQMKVRGNCYGDINDCKIKLQNASTAGFCVKQSLHDLSSHNANSQNQSIMAESTNANSTINSSSQPVQQQVNGQLYTWQPVQNPSIVTTTDNTNPIQTQSPSKQEREPDTGQKPGMEHGDNSQFTKPQNKEEEKDAQIESADDLKKVVSEQKKLIADMTKRMRDLEEDNVIRKQNEKRYFVSSKVAKFASNFKSKESFEKEVDTAVRYSQVMNEEELEQYLANKYAMEIKPRSAAVSTNNNPLHEVPNVQAQANNASSSSSDNNRKFIEVMDMFDNKGGV